MDACSLMSSGEYYMQIRTRTCKLDVPCFVLELHIEPDLEHVSSQGQQDDI